MLWAGVWGYSLDLAIFQVMAAAISDPPLASHKPYATCIDKVVSPILVHCWCIGCRRVIGTGRGKLNEYSPRPAYRARRPARTRSMRSLRNMVGQRGVDTLTTTPSHR